MERWIHALMIGGAMSLTACVSSYGLQKEFAATEVLERMPGHEEAPEWSYGAAPISVDKTDIVYANTLSMSGDSRPEVCTNAASDLGRVQILREIRDHLTSSGQLNEVSAASDPGVESLSSYLTQGQLSGVKVAARYWEKRTESDVNGLRVLRLHCAAKVAITRSSLEQQLRNAVGKSGNADIRQKLHDAQKRFIDGISDNKEPSRDSAAVE
jgi:hypothetical protein